jgi:hypothetical protein
VLRHLRAERRVAPSAHGARRVASITL